jgi:hypothetical protein
MHTSVSARYWASPAGGVDVDLTTNDGGGDVTELEIVVTGLLAQRLEGNVHADVVALSDDPLRLLDDHSAIEGVLQLLSEDRRTVDGPLLQDADARDICQCLRDSPVGIRQRRGGIGEHIQSPNDLVTKPERHRSH